MTPSSICVRRLWHNSRMKFRIPLVFSALLGLALCAGIVTGIFLLGGNRKPPQTSALLLNPPKPLPEFTLQDHDGAAFTRARLEGHWNLLYFGYTHCPDACPTTLADLNRFEMQLASLPEPARPRVYFISVDPQRDTPALLEKYAHYFNPSFVGVTGTLDELHNLTGKLGVSFSYDPEDRTGDYAVSHSSVVFLVDPKGEETALYTPPLLPDRMVSDYRAILRYYGTNG